MFAQASIVAPVVMRSSTSSILEKKSKSDEVEAVKVPLRTLLRSLDESFT